MNCTRIKKKTNTRSLLLKWKPTYIYSLALCFQYDIVQMIFINFVSLIILLLLIFSEFFSRIKSTIKRFFRLIFENSSGEKRRRIVPHS